MQFKKQGRRIQVLAYRGYDKIKRRAIVKMMGSYDVHTYELSVGLMDNLTGEEKIELQSHINMERQAEEKRVRQIMAEYLANRMREVANAIQDKEFDPNDAWAVDTWAAIDALGKALRKAGYPRSRKRLLTHSSAS